MPAIRPVLLAVVAIAVTACTWSPQCLTETKSLFHAQRTEFVAAVDEARKLSASGTLATEERSRAFASRHPKLCAEGFSVQSDPFIVEFTPVDFYYVLLHVDDRKWLPQSHAMTDEGSIKDDLGDGWFVVQRGFM